MSQKKQEEKPHGAETFDEIAQTRKKKLVGNFMRYEKQAKKKTDEIAQTRKKNLWW